MEERIIVPKRKTEEVEIDQNLRPRNLGEYIGQEKIKETLSIYIKAAKNRGEPLEHILFYGPPGLGKTTLAHIIANEMGVNIKSTSGPVIERSGDLAALLTNLEENDVLFIDEIHRLSHAVEELLYPAMESYRLDVVVGKGPGGRVLKLGLPRFTLVGATTRAGLLTSPLRDRFGITQRLDFYQVEEIYQIINRSASLLYIEVDQSGAYEISRRSRGTPRVANRLLRRVRDYAQVRAQGKISKKVAEEALAMLEVDEWGMDSMDRRLLLTIIEKFTGGPVGIESLAVALGEEADTIEDLYEPYLIQIGFLQRTFSGRKVTPLAYQRFGINFPGESQELPFTNG